MVGWHDLIIQVIPEKRPFAGFYITFLPDGRLRPRVFLILLNFSPFGQYLICFSTVSLLLISI